MNHSESYLAETSRIACELDAAAIERLVHKLHELRARRGRLFLAGLGGSAANASHAASDFRKLAEIEAYALNDNAAELTARANDETWASVYEGMLYASRAGESDALMVLSVGGGTESVSLPLVRAINYAKGERMAVLGIVGRDGGYTKTRGDAVVVVPNLYPERVTPHAEAFQVVVLHCLVSHPLLQKARTTW